MNYQQLPTEHPFGSPPSVAPPVYSQPSRTPAKVLAPAIAIVCLAVLNCVWAIDQLNQSLKVIRALTSVAADDSVSEGTRGFAQRMSEKTVNRWIEFIVAITVSLGMAIGGIMMMRMRIYPLALTGAILSMIPCATVTGCCGAGQAIGIWALVILMNPEVRGSFR